METTTGGTTLHLDFLKCQTSPNGSFRIAYPPKKSKTLEFFDDLYTYPPKFRVKWDTIDELHEDLFMSYNYRVRNPNLPFMGVLTDFFSTEDNGVVKKINYPLVSYFDGYLNKLTSTKFYANSAKKSQELFQNIPVYVILNGQGEIVLANSTDSLNSATPTVAQVTYDFCGNFDQSMERNKQLGLFFMSKDDAEVYLNEIAKFDTQGTKMFGLSIHCFGLDFAYRVTRDYHPNTDFRFVPCLSEVQSLLTPKSTGNSNLVFENSQQQLRFRNRSFSALPIFGSLKRFILPLSSFLEKTEYFKGVPIYVVKVNSTANNFFVNQYYNMLGLCNKVSSYFIKSLNKGLGFGNSWILEGSIYEQNQTGTTKTFVFFEKDAAIKFCERYNNRILSYNGKRSFISDPFVKKPGILVHNLEDFLEMWEENISVPNSTEVAQNTIFDSKNIQLIPSTQASLEVNQFLQQDKKSPSQKILQFVNFKYRRLIGFFDLLLNTD